MINLKSQTYLELSQSLSSDLESLEFKKWQSTLNKSESVDGFLVLFNHPIFQKLISNSGFSSFNDWILNAKEWSDKILNPLNDTNPESLILYNLWDSLCKHLVESLKKSRLTSELPKKGGVFCFIGGLSKCLIFKYEIISEYPKIQLIDVIDDPKSVFDFWSIINDSGLREKNILKEIISSGHKIIYNRGIAIHVDRRKDLEVFGPTIDTLLLAEILNQNLFENNSFEIKNAIEIGCGNGLLTVCLAKYSKNLEKLFSLDINFLSLACCYRNIYGNINPFQIEKINLNLLKGSFDSELFNYKFDLIVCNPPYIPLVDQFLGKYQSKRNYFEAVGGLELIDELLDAIENLLSKDGKLLILVSSLSLDYAISRIPNGFAFDLIIKEGYDVLFDVEAVLSNQQWFDFLKETGGLFERGGMVYHKLFPIWIYRK